MIGKVGKCCQMWGICWVRWDKAPPCPSERSSDPASAQSSQGKRAGSNGDRLAGAQPADADRGARLRIVHDPPRGIRHADLTHFSPQEPIALHRIFQVVGARVKAPQSAFE